MTKVLRLSDGKVFSSTRGAAMEADKPIERAIYYCCRGYLPSVQGEKYEWFYDDFADKGVRAYNESYWSRKGKWTSRGWVLKWRAMFIKAWLDHTYIRGAWLRTPQISRGICEAADQMDEAYKWKPTPQSISKHLHVYNKLYKKAFGMYEHFLDVPGYKGRLFKFVLDEADAELDIVLQELANDGNWGCGKPVIRIDDGKKFRSMAEAERVTGVPYYRIFHCCEGDIPYCKISLSGEKMEFKYATEVDRK